MLSNPEISLSGLEKQYGHEVKASPNLKCFPNAVHAAFHIFRQTKGEVLPRIWRVVIPEINDSHAYLQIGKDIYNQGITWPDGKYPDFTLQEITQRGLDVTTTALTQAYLELTGKSTGPAMGFKEAINLLGYSDPASAVQILDQMITKSVTSTSNF